MAGTLLKGIFVAVVTGSKPDLEKVFLRTSLPTCACMNSTVCASPRLHGCACVQPRPTCRPRKATQAQGGRRKGLGPSLTVSHLVHVHAFESGLQHLEVVDELVFQAGLELDFLQQDAAREQHIHELAVRHACKEMADEIEALSAGFHYYRLLALTLLCSQQ